MGFSIEYKEKETFLQSPPAKKMKYDDHIDEMSVVYPCGACRYMYNTYKVLLKHLYWKHGTEGQQCPKCPIKKWAYGAHICFLLPTTDIEFDNEEDTTEVLHEPPKKKVNTEQLLKDLYVSDSEKEDDNDLKVTAVQLEVIAQSQRESEYCFCGKNDDSPMIGCDNEQCQYQWFHYHCVGIEIVPDGDWYCPQCT